MLLDISNIPVKMKPHWSEWETKTVCHERSILNSVVKPHLKRQHSVKDVGVAVCHDTTTRVGVFCRLRWTGPWLEH